MSKHPMTVEGEAALRAELNKLKFEVRPRIIEAIAVARAHGDLKENGEYHAAREQQSFNEGRIQELEAKLSNVQIINIRDIPNTGKVIFGSTVTVLQVDTEQESVWRIVGEDEADIKEGKISYSSPMGKALIGKQVGDTAIVHAPGGALEYEIITVDYQ